MASARRSSTFNAGSSVTVENNTITGTDHPNYGVAFINTDSPTANGNTISSTSSAIIDAGTFTSPVSHSQNVFTDNAINIDLEPSGTTAVTVSGSEGPDFLQGTSGADHLSGLGGDDTLQGFAGNDTLTGGGGNDTIDGGSGTDTAQYAGTVSLATDGSGGWTANGGASVGTDTLTNVEQVDDAAAGKILLVGNGGYATVSAALAAAASDDTVFVGNGTYNENITLKSGVNLTGESEAGVVINGTVSTPASLDDATISNLTVQNVGNGMLLNMKGTSEITDAVFDHVTFSLSGNFSGEAPIGNGQAGDRRPDGTSTIKRERDRAYLRGTRRRCGAA